MFTKQPDLTYAEYLVYEHESKTKHEFVNGEVFAMTGVSEDRNVIASNLVACIRPRLRGSSCRVFSSDMKLTIASANNATYYPNVS